MCQMTIQKMLPGHKKCFESYIWMHTDAAAVQTYILGRKKQYIWLRSEKDSDSRGHNNRQPDVQILF